MVDEKKVKLMTRLAIYEKHEKSRGLVMSKYFQGDFVRYNILKTLVSVTICFWAVVGYYVFTNFDVLLITVSEVDYFDVMYKLLGAFAKVALVYFAASFLIYNLRYEKAKKGLIRYNSDLRDLIELEGGPAHYSKVKIKINDDTMGTEAFEERRRPVLMADGMASKKASNDTEEVIERKPRTVKQGISRAEMIKQKQMEQDATKAEAIKANAARLAKQREEKAEKERKAAVDRQKILERRRQLEKEQLERMRQEQYMNRENHEIGDSNTNGNFEGSNR